MERVVHRRVGGIGHGHTARPMTGMIACHRQRRQVADRTAGHEAATGAVRQTRQVGEESQHLVLRADRAGRFEP